MLASFRGVHPRKANDAFPPVCEKFSTRFPFLGILETWMSTNCLRLNPSKTQFIWFGTRQQLVKLHLSVFAADFSHFIFSPVVRDLGVTLDQELTFAPQIHPLYWDSYNLLRQLRTVVRLLTSDATATLIHA